MNFTSMRTRAPDGLQLPDAVAGLVLSAYAEPSRAYHGLGHLEEVLDRFAEVGRQVGWPRPAEVFCALLFHDAVYRPGAPDNESQSAEVARQALSPMGGLDLHYIARLIDRTAHHGSFTAADVTKEEALFMDCDMAILGAGPEAFDAYDQGIAQEYSALDPELFRAGRRGFLEKLASSGAIFLSPHFHGKREAAAHANLQRRLAKP